MYVGAGNDGGVHDLRESEPPRTDKRQVRCGLRVNICSLESQLHKCCSLASEASEAGMFWCTAGLGSPEDFSAI